MTHDANRLAAINLVTSLAEPEVDLSNFAPDATWWAPGRPEMNEEEFRLAYGRLQAALESGGRMEIHNVVGQDNRFAIEAASFFRAKDGGTYNNVYHFLIEFSGTEIVKVREYCDTAYVADFMSRAASLRQA